MNFNSPSYFVFLPIVVALFFLSRRNGCIRDIILLCASYYFYMSWNWKYAGLIALSTLVDFWVVIAMAKVAAPWARRLLLVVSLVVNLGMLAVFKYYYFTLEIADTIFAWRDYTFTKWHHGFLLPVGISFYTFQTMSYTIDAYRGKIDIERNFVKFAIFVSFFPQLVAGPIVRARDFIPQLQHLPAISKKTFDQGLFLIFQGLLKKTLFADMLSHLAVDKVFSEPGAFSSWDLIFALYGYAFQIYNDFSGYSDIAIGSAKLMGFEFPVNFDRPYVAANLREFWSRWHISLSTWIRDYLYFPLGGSLYGPRRTTFNLFITMLLAGLWHGAALNFVLWGAYHGVLLIATHRGWLGAITPRNRLAQQVVCFHLVCVGWLLFRIDSIGMFLSYLRGISCVDLTSRLSGLYYAILATAALAHLFENRLSGKLSSAFSVMPSFLQGALMATLIIILCGCSLSTPNFIYFQF